MSVDLPAPLSPRRQTTSPACTAIDTSSSAMTEPKYFETERASMSGVFGLSAIAQSFCTLRREYWLMRTAISSIRPRIAWYQS